MKVILGLGLIIVGIVLGLYAGLWWAFVGGIIDMIQGLTASPIDAQTVAWGVVRILFSGFIGWMSALICLIPGVALLK